MTEYYKDDMIDPDREIIRPKGTKKGSSFAYCKWAAGDWEARFYVGTPTHTRECQATVHHMVNNPCWFKDINRRKVDKRAASQNNRAKGSKK